MTPGCPPARDMVWIDRAPVTNAQFRKFVKATGHVTVAEQPADPASIVFVPPPGPIGTGDPYRWWQYLPGACWRHPVVHVAHGDAVAYAPRATAAATGPPPKWPRGSTLPFVTWAFVVL